MSESIPLLLQSYTALSPSFYQSIWPEPHAKPQLIAVNRALMSQLDCDLSNEALTQLTAGQLQDDWQLQPLAQKYTGHQFGYYNPDLGDGRGLLLGQWQDKHHQAWDFHLKGAGRTPFSRRGDGRAVLRSVIREYLASEALYGLGVPTTRALAIVTSDEQVCREQMEPRASLLRVTPSHIRFGHFQYAASLGVEALTELLNYTLQQHYPELLVLPEAEQAAALLKTVCQRTATLMAHWQTVGFNHGVMNSDNMSILGETFDFGPYGFFDDFQIGYVCNHSDTEARYAYNEQPRIGVWNCQVLAAAFQDLVTEAEQEAALNAYVETYNRDYMRLMATKLGWLEVLPDDKQLVGDLLILMDAQRVDFSLFFRRLSEAQSTDAPELLDLLGCPKDFDDWFARYQARLEQDAQTPEQRRQQMKQANPSLLLRNYIAQEIIEAAEAGDYEPLEKWTERLHHPFADYPELERYQQPPNQDEKGIALSCSS